MTRSPKGDYCNAVSKSPKLNHGRDQERGCLETSQSQRPFYCPQSSEERTILKKDIVSFIGSDGVSSVRTGAGHL